MTRNAFLPYLWMLLSCVAFSLMAALAHALGARCAWPVIAVARSGLALVFAGGLAVATGTRLVWWRPPTLWIRSLAGSVSMVCTFFAFSRLPVSDVLTIANMLPVWVTLLSWPLLGETPSGQVWVMVGVGVVGVMLVQQPHFAQGNFATLAALFGSFTSAIAMIGLHKLHGIDARAIVVHFSAVAALVCGAALLMAGPALLLPAVADGWTLLMLLGVGATATVGQLLLTKAYAAGSPARVAVVGLTQVVMGLVVDMLLIRHHIGPMSLLGMALVVAPTGWLLTHRRAVAADVTEVTTQ